MAGYYNTVALKLGKKYGLRHISTSVENHFKVSLDSHKFTVIQADFVPIVPNDTTWSYLAIGQRYDVVFTAAETRDNYWFCAETQTECGITSNNLLAIFNNGVKPTDPITTKTSYIVSRVDETTLAPYVSKSVPREDFVVTSK